ncbi:heptosyltransferase II [Burkholderiales bacterium]|nr:MAG: lipopolysaccharide heptosyltransferase II [Burkholderiales bacterium]CAG1007337.1 heptosyltransferase II [Burkholderiales bacterium]
MARLLIVAPSWVGDAVMMQPMLRLLREVQPECAIDVLAPAWCAPVIGRMPEVEALHANPFAHGQLVLAKRWRLARELALRGYQQALILPNSFKSALLPWFAGIRRRTGFLGEQRYGLVNDRPAFAPQSLPRLVDRYAGLALGRPPHAGETPQPRLLVDREAQRASIERLGLALDRPVFALCPGAEYGSAKRWPADHFATLARMAVENGFVVWVLGSAKDQAICAAIAGAAPRVIDLAGRTRLNEVVDLLALACCVVSNDSGLMHLAAAVNVPLVALYGSSSPGYTPPLSDRARILRLELECSPCFQRECPLGHLRCLKEIAPEQVWSAAQTSSALD